MELKHFFLDSVDVWLKIICTLNEKLLKKPAKTKEIDRGEEKGRRGELTEEDKGVQISSK